MYYKGTGRKAKGRKDCKDCGAGEKVVGFIRAGIRVWIRMSG